MEKYIKQSTEDKSSKEKKNINLNGLFDNKKSLLVSAGVIGALAFMYLFFKGSSPSVEVKTGVTPKDVKKTVTEIVTPIYQQQKEIKKQQEETIKTLSSLQKTLQELNKTLEKQKTETPSATNTKISTSIVPKEVIEGGSVKAKAKPKPLFHHKELKEPKKKKKYGLQTASTYSGLKKKTSQKKKKPTVYIPAGSIVEGRLMFGFVAPEKGMFPPVVVEFTKPIRTANDWYIPAQKCLVTTSAQYDISQGLAILGGIGSKLSCVLKSGKVVEIPVNIAVGEEIKGKTVQMGLTGEEKWLTPKDFATITSMYSLSGMAGSYKEGLVQQNMTPQGNVVTAIKNRGLYSVLGGVNQGVNKFVDFWMRKYDKKVPAIKVKPKKHLFVVFVNGANLKITPEEL